MNPREIDDIFLMDSKSCIFLATGCRPEIVIQSGRPRILPFVGQRLENKVCRPIACEYSHFSLLLATRDILLGRTSDVNQCLHNKYSSHGVPNVYRGIVDHGKVLCSTVNQLQQNSDAFSKEEYNYSRNIDCFVVD